MQDKHDPVDDVLETLGGRSWPQGYDNQKIKEKIMKDMHTNGSGSRLGRRGAMVAALAVALLGTAGFAAVGGVEMVQGWFITIEVNGEEVDIGDANVEVQIDGATATITVDGIEGDFEDGEEMTVTVTGSMSEDGRTVIINNVNEKAPDGDGQEGDEIDED